MSKKMGLKSKVRNNKLFKENITKLAIIREQVNNFSFQRQAVKNFIVVCRGRSGSTCFLDLLSSHPQILADPHNFFDHEALPLNFEDTRFVNSHKNVLGFKFRTQLEDQDQVPNKIEIAQTKYNNLVEQGVQIFYLRRDNILNRAISKVIANSKHRKHNYRQEENVPDDKFKLLSDEILQQLESCVQQTKFDQAVMAEVPHILINYERDLENQDCHQETLDRCCQSLQLDRVQAQTKFVKISPKQFESYIVNWQEIYDSVLNSPYKSYLPK